MIKKILFPIALIIAIVLGGVGADFLRNKAALDAVGGKVDAPKNKTSHDKKKDKKKSDDGHGKKEKKKKKKTGHGEEEVPSIDIAYMKFKRQFVVPVMRDNKIQSLVLLNINLELKKSAPQNVYTLEPKLRDAIMRELLKLSHEGAFSSSLTSAATYDNLREALLNAVQSVIKDGVSNVLILDLMRQDQ
jgi:primosomal protein N'